MAAALNVLLELKVAKEAGGQVTVRDLDEAGKGGGQGLPRGN